MTDFLKQMASYLPYYPSWSYVVWAICLVGVIVLPMALSGKAESRRQETQRLEGKGLSASPVDATPAGSGLVLIEPVSNARITTPTFSLAGAGAAPSGNSMTVEAVYSKTGERQLVKGRFTSDSEGNWQYQDISLTEPGEYNLQITGYFGGKETSRKLTVVIVRHNHTTNSNDSEQQQHSIGQLKELIDRARLTQLARSLAIRLPDQPQEFANSLAKALVTINESLADFRSDKARGLVERLHHDLTVLANIVVEAAQGGDDAWLTADHAAAQLQQSISEVMHEIGPGQRV